MPDTKSCKSQADMMVILIRLIDIILNDDLDNGSFASSLALFQQYRKDCKRLAL